MIITLILALFGVTEQSLVWTDHEMAFAVRFDASEWIYTQSEDSLHLTHQSLDGLELSVTVRSSDPADPSLADLAKQTLYRKGERQAAAVTQEHNLGPGELKSMNADEGYYYEGVYGPDMEPISVRVLVLKRSGRILIAEGDFPGTEKQNSYSWRKCQEALNIVWQTISGAGKVKK